MSEPTLVKSRPDPSATAETSRPPAGKPALLSEMPGTFYTSPAFVLGIVAVEVLYGFVLLIVMSNLKRERPRPEIGTAERDRLLLAKASQGATPKVESPKAETKPKPEQATKPEIKEETKPTPKKAEPPPPAKVEPPPQAKIEQAAPTQVPKTQEAAKAEVEQAAPKPEATTTPSPAPEPPALARLSRPEVVPKPEVTIPEEPLLGLGPLIDPDHDCKAEQDADGVTISIPGTLHALSPHLNTWNAPRILKEVDGNFTVQVTIAGEVRPGINPLKHNNVVLPFTFQGAGLLIWENNTSFVRLERSELFMRRAMHHVRLEYFSHGHPRPPVELETRDEALMLRIERKDDQLNCTYSTDNGKTWVRVKRWAAGLQPKVQVGVSASNFSPKPFNARFEDFHLSTSDQAGQ